MLSQASHNLIASLLIYVYGNIKSLNYINKHDAIYNHYISIRYGIRRNKVVPTTIKGILKLQQKH